MGGIKDEHLDPRRDDNRDDGSGADDGAGRRTRRLSWTKEERYAWFIERLGLPVAIIVVLWIFILQPMANDHFATNNLLRTNLEGEAKTNLRQGFILEKMEGSLEKQTDAVQDQAAAAETTAKNQQKTAELLQQLLDLQLREVPRTRQAVEALRPPDSEK